MKTGKLNTGVVQVISLSTTNRDLLTPVNGMVIYNTTDNQLQAYINSTWTSLAGGGSAEVLTGLDSARPAAGAIGQLYLPTDSPVYFQSDGAAWQPKGFNFSFNGLPDIGDFTQRNGLDTPTAVEQNNGSIYVFKVNDGDSHDITMYTQELAGAEYTVTLGFLSGIAGHTNNYCTIGVCVTDGTNVIAFGTGNNVTDNHKTIAIQRFSDLSNFSANTLLQYQGNIHGCPYFFRIRQTATTRYYETSNDGQHFAECYSEAADLYITETEVGFYVNPSNADAAIIVTSFLLEE